MWYYISKHQRWFLQNYLWFSGILFVFLSKKKTILRNSQVSDNKTQINMYKNWIVIFDSLDVLQKFCGLFFCHEHKNRVMSVVFFFYCCWCLCKPFRAKTWKKNSGRYLLTKCAKTSFFSRKMPRKLEILKRSIPAFWDHERIKRNKAIVLEILESIFFHLFRKSMFDNSQYSTFHSLFFLTLQIIQGIQYSQHHKNDLPSDVQQNDFENDSRHDGIDHSFLQMRELG